MENDPKLQVSLPFCQGLLFARSRTPLEMPVQPGAAHHRLANDENVSL
jgi:hypothetical protein